MMIPNLQVPFETMSFQNPSLVVDESFEYHKITPSDSQCFQTLTLDDQIPDLFPQLHDEIPHGYSVSAPETADYSAAACHKGLTLNKLNPELTTGEKLQVLIETLKPIPFKPSESLDFKSYEPLLRRLGLWDFVNIEFDTTIRGDLLVQLIASYTPNLLCGYVNGIKIMVNRDDLGRALKLPMEPTVASTENMVDALESVESAAFIEKLLSMWMVLHDDECIMPPEVLSCLRLIKEGQLEMIDWAGLIWSMVDKELKASQLEKCYYASHLQHLIKTQHEELVREECKVDIDQVSNKRDEQLIQGQDDDVEILDLEKEEDGEEHSMNVEYFKEESEMWPLLQQCNVRHLKGSEEEGFVEDEDDDRTLLGGMPSGISSMGMHSGSFIQEMEAGKILLGCGNGLSGNSEGQDDDVEILDLEKEEDGEEHSMNVEYFKEESEMWPLLQQCNIRHLKGSEEEGFVEDEDEDDDLTLLGGMPSGISSMGMHSGSFIQETEAGKIPLGCGNGQSGNSEDFFTYREHAQMVSGPSSSGNGHGRYVDQDDHNSYQSPTLRNKRQRSDSLCDDKPEDFNMCMEHIQHLMGEARMMYAAKAQACEESSMSRQFLLNELQKSDRMIDHLRKAHPEESQKGRQEVFRLEREVYMMGKLLEGYRKSLKETQQAFNEYRIRCTQASEPVYKEVPDSAGKRTRTDEASGDIEKAGF